MSFQFRGLVVMYARSRIGGGVFLAGTAPPLFFHEVI
jgi:hypothetical protein